MSRTKNTTRNSVFATVNFSLKLLLSFISRAIFIKFLGAEYLGLNGLVGNILSFLAIAELGIGNAVAYALYKPVAEGNIEKINSLIQLYKKVCFAIAAVITAAGLLIMPFLPMLIKGDWPAEVNLYVVYLIYLANSAVGYLFAHRHILFLVYQRNDIESKVSAASLLSVNIVQILLLILFGNYYVYLIISLIFSLLSSLVIVWISRRMFKEITGKGNALPKEDKQKIIKHTSAMFFHRIGAAVVNSTDNLIISSFLGLSVLGLYSNYAFIISALMSFVQLILGAFRGSIGNLIAEKPPEEVYKIYSSLLFLLFWISAFSLTSLLVLFHPFISLWIGGGFKIDTLTMILLSVNFYFQGMRSVNIVFMDCAGLMRKSMLNPVFEVVINLVASIILVNIIGLPGVILGTIISTVAVCFWREPYIIYRYYFKERKLRDFTARYAVYIILSAAVAVGTYFITSFIPRGGIVSFVALTGICAVLPNLIFFIAYHRTDDFRYLLSSAKRMLKRKRPQTEAVAPQTDNPPEDPQQ